MADKSKIIVSGIAFWYPLGGVFWQFLHYLLGLRQLGHDAYYVEDSARDVYDPSTNDFTPNPDANISAVAPMLEKYGFKDKWCFRSHTSNQQRCYGLSESELNELYHDADAFLNVTGAQEICDEHLRIPRRIYIETDPVASQIKVAQGDETTINHLAAHDCHFTYGENIGRSDCLLPTARFNWFPTRQPIILDSWQHSLPPGDSYSTITTWKNKGRDITWNGETYYWSKDLEFANFLTLPWQSKVTFELATNPDPTSKTLLEKNGWRIIPSIALSLDFNRYRDYIQSSRGEFTVAKDQNIRLKSGWFSDRSACYLASARPVITQETGFSNHLPTGQGLFAFRTMQDILFALDKIESDYPKASRAALDIAHSHFSAQVVLQSLLSRAGL
ncbi:MAG TPA: hypothetical protein VGQ99_19740 [Tepidisphaeraceae bacterium]|jgi:hypothetical protein|nr:hypothetical protein [Tepidisphaeraceae bacterium]